MCLLPSAVSLPSVTGSVVGWASLVIIGTPVRAHQGECKMRGAKFSTIEIVLLHIHTDSIQVPIFSMLCIIAAI